MILPPMAIRCFLTLVTFTPRRHQHGVDLCFAARTDFPADLLAALVGAFVEYTCCLAAFFSVATAIGYLISFVGGYLDLFQ